MSRISLFEFGTKADNLLKLQSYVTKSTIPKTFTFRVREWQQTPERIMKQISSTFINGQIAIRSSAVGEDSFDNSLAGAFESVLHIDLGDKNKIVEGIEKVIESYRIKSWDDINQFQVIIQPMIRQISSSGVIFTRDLEMNGPYYVINYDDSSGRTDSVTSGDQHDILTLYVHRNAEEQHIDEPYNGLIEAVKEIEYVTSNDRLDIEFAIDRSGVIYILQVRPLVFKKIMRADKQDQKVKNILNIIESHYIETSKYSRAYGKKLIYGQMPDWNPAEIIGSHPRRLATSLYNQVVMYDAWRKGRVLLGYYDPSPENLMCVLGGRPYVNVKSSFYSLLPQGLSKELSRKLIDYYLDRLERNPHLHDKVEFEIVISCLTLDYEQQSKQLIAHQFTESEVFDLKQALLHLTDNIISNHEELLNDIETSISHLAERREELNVGLAKVEQIPYFVKTLIEDCKLFGTIPFSAAARCAFIGNVFLKSLVNVGLISETAYFEFLASIETVATQMMEDLEELRTKKIDIQTFLNRYGHLRPGTYDILTYSYREKPDLYFSEINKSQFSRLTNKSAIDQLFPHNDINQSLKKTGFSFDSNKLLQFVRNFIQLREQVKFEFTKNIDCMLRSIVQYGEYFGLSRDDLSYLDVSDIIQGSNVATPPYFGDKLKSIIEFNKETYTFEKAVHLPDIIFSLKDFEVIKYERRQPNFITQHKVIAKIICLDDEWKQFEPEILSGKIVLIEKADPGYDWLFAHQISGLITKYGGVASHMSIRCAEFSLPAAIGCGDVLYNSIKNSSQVHLNCKDKKVEPMGVSP